MEHGRLWRFECAGCFEEHVAVVETPEDAIADARENGWQGEDDLWYCPNCKWDGDEPDGLVTVPGFGTSSY